MVGRQNELIEGAGDGGDGDHKGPQVLEIRALIMPLVGMGAGVEDLQLSALVGTPKGDYAFYREIGKAVEEDAKHQAAAAEGDDVQGFSVGEPGDGVEVLME